MNHAPAPAPARNLATRTRPVLLAAIVSLAAAVLAVVLHTVGGVTEEPLVIGTIVGASIIGWLNTDRAEPAAVRRLTSGRRATLRPSSHAA